MSPAHYYETTYLAYQRDDKKSFDAEMHEWLSLSLRHSRGKSYGDALHMHHTYLGLWALRDGNLELAKDELLRSGQVPRTPVLFSFGPNCRLLEGILLNGEWSCGLRYLHSVRRFWLMGWWRLYRWRRQLRRREIPDFRGNLYYMMPLWAIPGYEAQDFL